MRKASTVFLTTAVLLWILPLGAFIKPSQEKTACDGKRAFHMCSMMSSQAKVQLAPSQAPAITAPASPAKAASGSGAGNEFLLPQVALSDDRSARFEAADILCAARRLVRPVDHIPLTA